MTKRRTELRKTQKKYRAVKLALKLEIAASRSGNLQTGMTRNPDDPRPHMSDLDFSQIHSEQALNRRIGQLVKLKRKEYETQMDIIIEAKYKQA